VVLALRRPGLLACIVVTLALPQIALARVLDGEGLTGCRYFLPAFPLLALLAATAIEPFVLSRLARTRMPRNLVTRTRARRRIALVLAAIALAATAGSAWPMYRYMYTYQAEYRFLREQLASAPRPARVFHVAVHDDPVFPRDPDCCLNPGRSPLALALPGIAFESLEVEPSTLPLPDQDEPIAYYYESAICGWGPTDTTEERDPGASAKVRERCERLAADPRLTLVASASVPARASWPLFPSAEVRLRLFRLSPARPP
jgi:4-amino-4-deoxy-L-arabinose transferase-like glycosyltransferase